MMSLKLPIKFRSLHQASCPSLLNLNKHYSFFPSWLLKSLLFALVIFALFALAPYKSFVLKCLTDNQVGITAQSAKTAAVMARPMPVPKNCLKIAPV